MRAFQAMRGEPPDPAFLADLEFLENRELDLSVRLGALLAFNALMVTVGTHLSASPGAPLSLDVARHPMEVVGTMIAILPPVVSSFLCLRALLLGEEFDAAGLESDDGLRQRLFAAFVRSIDAQALRLRAAIQCTWAGGAAMLALWTWILAVKLF